MAAPDEVGNLPLDGLFYHIPFVEPSPRGTLAVENSHYEDARMSSALQSNSVAYASHHDLIKVKPRYVSLHYADGQSEARLISLSSEAGVPKQPRTQSHALPVPSSISHSHSATTWASSSTSNNLLTVDSMTSSYLVAMRGALSMAQMRAANNTGKKIKKYHKPRKTKVVRKKPSEPKSVFDSHTAEENAKLSESRAFLTGKKRGKGKGPETSSKRRRKTAVDPSNVRGPWGRNEDLILYREVVKVGIDNIKWGEVAKKIPGRRGKQVRERWLNHLDPTILKTAFTKEEDAKLKELQAKLGNRWKKISDFMPGRTENQVKNRFNAPSFRRLNNVPLSQAPSKKKVRHEGCNQMMVTKISSY